MHADLISDQPDRIEHLAQFSQQITCILIKKVPLAAYAFENLMQLEKSDSRCFRNYLWGICDPALVNCLQCKSMNSDCCGVFMYQIIRCLSNWWCHLRCSRTKIWQSSVVFKIEFLKALISVHASEQWLIAWSASMYLATSWIFWLGKLFEFILISYVYPDSCFSHCREICFSHCQSLTYVNI